MIRNEGMGWVRKLIVMNDWAGAMVPGHLFVLLFIHVCADFGGDTCTDDFNRGGGSNILSRHVSLHPSSLLPTILAGYLDCKNLNNLQNHRI